MLKRFRRNDELDELVEDQIRAVLAEMDMTDKESEKYPELVTSLERLYEVKTKKRRRPVDSNTLALVAGNLLGILLIVAYEQANVMRSKAIDQVIKPRTTGNNPT